MQSYHAIFPGGLIAPNRNAIDWGQQGLLAYGACSYVVIADVVDTMKRIQTLDGHSKPVTKLRWAREQLQFRNEANYSLVLASGDEGGSILVWNIVDATIVASLNPGMSHFVPNLPCKCAIIVREDSKILLRPYFDRNSNAYGACFYVDGHEKLGAVVDMEWHSDKPHLLATVHAPSSLVLWNTDTATLVWRCDFGETLTSLSMNPFDKQHVCLSSSQGWIYFVRDFKEETKPVRVDVKYRINSGQTGSEASSKAASNNDAFQHMLFSPHHRNIVYFVLERRILIFDLTIHQTVGSIGWDKTKPAFRTLLVSKHHEHLLFALHDDGSLTTWRRRDANSQSFAYQSAIDVIRISKQTRKRDRSVIVVSAVACPSNKLLVSLLSSDGVAWCVAYDGPTVPVDQNASSPSLIICGELECVTTAISSISVWNEENIVPTSHDGLSGGAQTQFAISIASASFSLGPALANYQGNMISSYNTASTGITGGEMAPKTSNLVAVGTHDGRLLLVDMIENTLRRMFSVQPGSPLRGVRWISPTKVICFTTESVDKNLHRNRIKILDLGTGQLSEIRKKNEPEPTFIRGIRLSPSKLYLIVLLKDQPFQVWELKTGSLLRSLPFPHLTALEWNPSYPTTSVSGPLSSTSLNASGLSAASLNSSSSSSTSSGSTASVSSFTVSASSGPLFSSGPAPPSSATSSAASLQTIGTASNNTSYASFNTLHLLSGGSFDLSSPTTTNPSVINVPSSSIHGSVRLPSFFASGSSGSVPAPVPVAKASREQFVFANPDGTLHFYQVENNQVQALPGMKVEPGSGIIASIAWKDNLLVAGDTNGTIMSYQLDKKKVHTFETGKGLVRRLRFGPATEAATGGYHNILVLFNDGDFGIWDLDFNVRVSISGYFRTRDLKALDLDWWNASQPIVATTDGAIRLVDRTLSHGSNSPLLMSNISYPLNCPLILPPRQALFLKTMLNHPELVETASSSPMTTSTPPPSTPSSSAHSSLVNTTNLTGTNQHAALTSSMALAMTNSLAGLVPDSVLASLTRPGLPIAERCLLVARYFGNFAEERFWTLVIHSFKKKRTPPVFKGGSLLGPAAYASESLSISTASESAMSPSSSTSTLNNSQAMQNGASQPQQLNAQPSGSITTSSGTIINTSNTITIDAEPAAPKTPSAPDADSLPVYFDLLLDPDQLRTLHLNGAALHEKKRAQNYALTQSITDFHLTLGQKEKALELLLETPPDNAMYYADVLKACVVAASVSHETFRNTVKLVATSLIANGSVDEGVQLLSLIGKSLDACRYLQSHDRWIEAAQLAKLTLNYDDAGHIYKKWTDHLVTWGQYQEAIEIELTLGEYDVALALLHKANLFELAALFALAAREYGVLTEAWIKQHPTDPDTTPLAATSASLGTLLESVFLDYGWYLHKIGCKSAASYFLAELAGDAGKEAFNSLGLSPARPSSPPLSSAPSTLTGSNPGSLSNLIPASIATLSSLLLDDPVSSPPRELPIAPNPEN